MLPDEPKPAFQKHWQWPVGLDVLHERFLSAQPYPHLIVDSVFPEDSLLGVYADVPVHSSSLWTHWGSGGQGDEPSESSKRGISSLMLLSEKIANFLKLLNSDSFLQDISVITGNSNLRIDATFNGGGLHCTGRGGHLRIHADKNRHPRPSRFDQAINLILFINPHWSIEFGGALELWSRDGSERVVSIPPLFNRLILFKSDRTTYHGHPEPARCPIGMYRTSLAVYYYVPVETSVDPSQSNEILWK